MYCSALSHAQPFKKIIDINNDNVEDYTKSSVVYDDHLYFVVRSKDTISGSSTMSIVKSDLQGNIVDQNAIESSINTGFNSLIVVDSLLYYSDAPKIASDTSSYNLFQIDPNNLNVINKKGFKIGPPSEGIVQDGITTYNDWILLYGDNLEFPKSEGIILFVDNVSLELDTTIYFSPGNLQYGSVIDCQQVDDNLRVLRSNGYQDEFIVEDFDENLESISSFEITSETHSEGLNGWGTILYPENSIEIRKNGNIILGTTETQAFAFYHYDYNGRLLHRFEKEILNYGGYRLIRYLENSEGGLTLYGQANIGIYQGIPVHRDSFFTTPREEIKAINCPFLLKLDHNQNIVFNNLFAQLDPGELNDFNAFLTVHQLDDGSYICLGSGSSEQYEEYPFDSYWDKTGEVLMMRVSEDGCYDEEECFLTDNSWVSLTNTSETLEEDHFITLFPNPTNDYINVESEEIIETIRLMSIDGRLIDNKVVRDYNTQLGLSQLNPGIYFTIVTFRGIDKAVVRKVIKK